jgi:hypothetical protein
MESLKMLIRRNLQSDTCSILSRLAALQRCEHVCRVEAMTKLFIQEYFKVCQESGAAARGRVKDIKKNQIMMTTFPQIRRVQW